MKQITQDLKIAVIGGGFMGCSIATIYARCGFDVTVVESENEQRHTFAARALPIARSLSTDEINASEIVDKIRLTNSLDEAHLSTAGLVHETIQEDLEAKQTLFEYLDTACGADTVLATNTSTFLLSEICRDIATPERVIGIHFVSPAHIIRAVEIIVTVKTRGEVVDWARDFVSMIGHVGAVCRERPGFLVNRIQFAMLAEIYKLIDEGFATAEDIDGLVRGSLGPRLALWGPLLCEDLVVSKRTSLAVVDYLHQQSGGVSFSAAPIMRKLVADGHLGAAAGQGWYHWDKPYDEIVAARDGQLAELFAWLDKRKPLADLGQPSAG